MWKRVLLVGLGLLSLVAGARAGPWLEVVVRTSAGEPAAGARVLLLKSYNVGLERGEESMVHRSATANRAGRVRFPGFRSAVCVLAHLDGEAAFVCNHRIDGTGPARLDLTLGAATVVHGRLTGLRGDEFKEAKVRLHVAGGYEWHGLDATIERDGSFRLPPVPRARLLQFTPTLQATAPGCRLRSLRLGPARVDAPVILRMRETRVLTGRVVDPDGEPVSGACLLVYDDADPRFGPPFGSGRRGPRTGPDGRFEIANAPTARVLVYALPDGHAPFTGVFGPGTEATDLGDLLVRPGAPVTGVVKNAEGEGVPGAALAVRDPRGCPVRVGATERDGSFTLGAVGPGEHRLEVSVHSLAGAAGSLTLTVPVPTRGPAAVVLPPSLLLEIRTPEGDPVKFADLSVDISCPSSGEKWSQRFWCSEAVYSEFRLWLDGPAVYDLKVTLEGLDPILLEGIEIGADGAGAAVVTVVGHRRLLPPDPTEEQIREYVEAVLAPAKGRNRWSSSDPEVGKLEAVGPEHAGVLVKRLKGERHTAAGTYLHWALRKLVEDEHRELIVGALRDSPELVDIVMERDWCDEAKEILYAGLAEHPRYLPPDWIRAVATFRDEATYADLRWYLVYGQNPRHAVDAVRHLPGLDVEGAVADRWRREAPDPLAGRRFALVALQFGHLDAFKAAIGMLAYPERDRRRPFGLRKVILRHIDFLGGDDAIRKWFEANEARIRWDPKSKKYRVGD